MSDRQRPTTDVRPALSLKVRDLAKQSLLSSPRNHTDLSCKGRCLVLLEQKLGSKWYDDQSFCTAIACDIRRYSWGGRKGLEIVHASLRCKTTRYQPRLSLCDIIVGISIPPANTHFAVITFTPLRTMLAENVSISLCPSSSSLLILRKTQISV